MYNKNIKAYKVNNLQADLSVADPHRVIQLLMQGLLERLGKAKGYIERREYEKKAETISSILAILNGLQDSLDLTQGEISDNLLALYEYMKNRVMDANVQMDNAPLDEVANLMITIKSAWDQIPDAEKQKAYAERQSKEPSNGNI